MNMDKLLKYFYNITTAILALGVTIITLEDGLDIYTLWVSVAFFVGAYLINKNDK